jgi:dienelactone hydrolase
MLQLGMSWAGTIVWDDIRSVEFLAGLPEVDTERIGAVGLSMGSNRAWHLAAATDRIAAAAAICWLGTTESLMSPGNNQTKGQSAFSMTHPGLRNYLDYADVASIACPKPMLFYNGEKDDLFPLDGVRVAYAKMRNVWESQGAGDKLVTKIWPVPHVFNEAMQREAFNWLDTYLRPP